MMLRSKSYSSFLIAISIVATPADTVLHRIKIPLIMLASKDEPAEDVKKFEAALTGPKHVETFDDQIHGWMAARADLSDNRVKEEYTRAYKTVLTFFANNWS